MSDNSAEMLAALHEMRDLLRVIAEPGIAKRDEKIRNEVASLAGSSKKKQTAIMLMDGSRTRAQIHKQSGVDQGDVSRLVKAMTDKELLDSKSANPKLVIRLPENFF